MGWFKQLCLSLIILSAVVACVSGQELTNTLREGNHICPGDEVNFTCTIRGLSGMSVFVLGWSSDEYIGQGGSLQLSTIEIIGEVKTSTSMDGSITATATLTNNTNVNGEHILESTLHITGTVASTVTCSNSGTGVARSIEFSISAIPDAPRNVRAAEASERIDNNCIILVTWDPPTNIEVSDIDHYIITVPSRNIIRTESAAITALRIRNCDRNDSIQVAAVNRFGCVGGNSLQTRPSLLDIIAITTESITSTPIGSTTGTGTLIGSTTSTPTTSTPIVSTSAFASVIAVAIVAAVLFVIVIVLVLVLVLFMILYRRGRNVQAAGHGQVPPPEVLRLEEHAETETKLRVPPPEVLRLEKHIETETKLIGDLQKRVQDTSVKRNLEELYNALKLKLPSIKMQAAARDLKTTLMLGRESSRFKEYVKETFIGCLEALQVENDEVIQRVIENMDNILTGITSIDEKFKRDVRLLRTKIGTGELKKVLDDVIKRLLKDEASDIMDILLSLCENLRKIRQVKDYYCKQSKYDIQDLGPKEDRVSVPIWMDNELDDSWKSSLREAVQAINEAAPGLSLSIAEDEKRAIIHVLAINKEEPYTEVEGNILMRLKEKSFVTKIHLGKWKDDGLKKGVCIHEFFHALGFHHEHQYAIADSYVYRLDSGKQITIDKNELGFIQFDSFFTTLYPCEKKCKGNSEDHVCKWVLKEYPTKENTDLEYNELNMVGLNLVYPPCVDETANNDGYRPQLGRNGLYYCGREVMIARTYPDQKYTPFCGPDKGPNCPACRTIKSPQVEEILKGGRWQGVTGRVYCGRPFTEPGILAKKHDGMCGMDDGPVCPKCYKILNKEVLECASL